MLWFDWSPSTPFKMLTQLVVQAAVLQLSPDAPPCSWWSCWIFSLRLRLVTETKALKLPEA